VYKSFYSLKRNPFEISPDPTFLFPTRRHNEALAALYYGVRRHKGFVVLTGEVGTGKTLLVRCLLDLLSLSHVNYAYVYNPRLSALEFLQYVVADFGIPTAGKSKPQLLLDFSRFLIGRHAEKLTTVLVVDEAHHLSLDVLEEVRLLTNLETTQQKLLQILFAGQPELDEKLDSFELRQLKQRIALRCSLAALSSSETSGYIRRRLELCGLNGQAVLLFPENTIEAVYNKSGGIPRIINIVCENALINAYARRVSVVSPEIVEEVASDLRLGVVHKSQDQKGGEIDNPEVWEAAKTLLALHQLLRSTKPKSSDSLTPVSPGGNEQ